MADTMATSNLALKVEISLFQADTDWSKSRTPGCRQSRSKVICSQVIERIGRGERIRTSGLLVPNQALYQAEPRPDFFSVPRTPIYRVQVNDREKVMVGG